MKPADIKQFFLLLKSTIVKEKNNVFSYKTVWNETCS